MQRLGVFHVILVYDDTDEIEEAEKGPASVWVMATYLTEIDFATGQGLVTNHWPIFAPLDIDLNFIDISFEVVRILVR